MRKAQKRWVIVGNQSYGLYYGQVSASDAEIIASKAVRMTGCRHICRYYTTPGGITSLAADGPDATKPNRIGAPCSALLTGIVNVLDCTPKAVKAFESIAPAA